ncbi:hypothetical protein D3C80_2027840 [compost metagenome]
MIDIKNKNKRLEIIDKLDIDSGNAKDAISNYTNELEQENRQLKDKLTKITEYCNKSISTNGRNHPITICEDIEKIILEGEETK